MIRQIKLSRFPLCESCLLVGVDVPAVLVHHVDEDEFNNSDDNLLSICNKCHEKIHGKNRWKRKH
jgi:hypothetical protein